MSLKWHPQNKAVLAAGEYAVVRAFFWIGSPCGCEDHLIVRMCLIEPACCLVGTTDRFVRIFDCSLIGAEQTPEEAEEGPPEVVFVHGGHVAGITELDWNPLDEEFPWVKTQPEIRFFP